MPKFKQSTLLAFDSINDATSGVLKILAEGIEPVALELFEKDTIKYSEEFLKTKLESQKGDAYVLMTLDGDDMDSIKLREEMIQTLLKDITVEIISLDAEQEKAAWQRRDNILVALMKFTEFEMLDEVVPINRFAEMIQYTKELEDKHGLSVINFGHAGDGNIHTVLLKRNLEKETWEAKRKALLDDLYEKVNDLGGLPSAEHGIGKIGRAHV